jgi:cyclic lactone autoinducer peptide
MENNLICFILKEVYTMKKRVITLLTKVGKKAANASANTNCQWMYYQPEEPKAMKKMREAKEKKG